MEALLGGRISRRPYNDRQSLVLRCLSPDEWRTASRVSARAGGILKADQVSSVLGALYVRGDVVREYEIDHTSGHWLWRLT